jgi:hypothetical protein
MGIAHRQQHDTTSPTPPNPFPTLVPTLVRVCNADAPAGRLQRPNATSSTPISKPAQSIEPAQPMMAPYFLSGIRSIAPNRKEKDCTTLPSPIHRIQRTKIQRHSVENRPAQQRKAPLSPRSSRLKVAFSFASFFLAKQKRLKD